MSCDLNSADSFNYDRIYRNFTVNDGVKHKTLFCDPVEQILARANNYAREVLGKEPKPILPKIKKQGISDERPPVSNNTTSPKVTVNTFSSGWGWGASGGGTLLLAAISAVISAAATIGKSFAEMQNIHDEKSQTSKIYNAYKLHQANSPNIDIISSIFNKYLDLLSKRRANAIQNCLLSTVLISSAILLGASVAASFTVGMVAGSVLVAATLSVIALKFFFNLNRRGPECKIAEDLRKDWKALQAREPKKATEVSHDLQRSVEKFAETLRRKDQSRFKEYALDIVLSLKSLKDPKAYIRAWIKQRGGSEEWRLPEDQALNFFKKHYNVSSEEVWP
jgi:hypothetical protein